MHFEFEKNFYAKPAIGITMALILGIATAEAFLSKELLITLVLLSSILFIVALIATFFIDKIPCLRYFWSFGAILFCSFSAGYIFDFYEISQIEKKSLPQEVVENKKRGEYIIATLCEPATKTKKALRMPIKILSSKSLPISSKWMLYSYNKGIKAESIPQVEDTIVCYVKEAKLRNEVDLLSYKRWLRCKNSTGILYLDNKFQTAKESVFTINSRFKAHSIKAKALSLRSTLLNRIKKMPLKEETKALIGAIALGYKDDDLALLGQNFQELGVAHILSVSGFHLAIICSFVYFLVGWIRYIPKLFRLRPILIIVAAWLFALLTGFSPATIRAALMLSLYQINFLLYRSQNKTNILFFSAFVLLICHPGYIYDIGFQLSFISVLSILLFYPFLAISRKIKLNPLVRYLYSSIALCLSAQILSFPLVLYHFGTTPLVFIWSNIPLVFLASLLIPLSLVFILLMPYLSSMPIIWDSCMAVLEFLSQKVYSTLFYLHPTHFFAFRYSPSLLQVVGIYLLLFACYWIIYRLLPESIESKIISVKEPWRYPSPRKIQEAIYLKNQLGREETQEVKSPYNRIY